MATKPVEAASGAMREGPWVERFARFGLASKGVLYAVIGGLAVAVAAGAGGKATDKGGALRTIAQQPAGEVMLFVLALGLAGYTAWRIAQAVFDRDDRGDGIKALAVRGSKLGSGVVYGGLMVLALWLVFSSDDSGGGGGREKEATAGVLGWPGGRWIVALAALVIVGVGAYNVARGVRRKFMGKLQLNKMTPSERRGACVVGVTGLCARGAVFGLIGAFLMKAAIEFDPREAVGLDGALARLVGEPYGRPLLGLVAAGLCAYALLCVVEARWKDV